MLSIRMEFATELRPGLISALHLLMEMLCRLEDHTTKPESLFHGVETEYGLQFLTVEI